MSESPPDRTLPRSGDIVVTREPGLAGKYTVRQVPGSAQFHTSAQDEAIQLARLFAQRTSVDLWYCEEGIFRLLEAYGEQRS